MMEKLPNAVFMLRKKQNKNKNRLIICKYQSKPSRVENRQL